MNKLGIYIVVTENGEELTSASANSWESAEEEFGKLERWYKGRKNRYNRESDYEPEDNYKN